MALAFLALMSLVIFWGVINIFFRFLDINSYFAVSPSTDVASSESMKERNQEMSDFLKERTKKRQEASIYPEFGNEEKDPFRL